MGGYLNFSAAEQHSFLHQRERGSTPDGVSSLNDEKLVNPSLHFLLLLSSHHSQFSPTSRLDIGNDLASSWDPTKAFGISFREGF